MDLLSNLRSMLALLSPDSLNALQRYNPASFRLGFFILSVSMNLFFFPFLHSLVILESFLMTLSFLNQVISGKGLASKMHSRMRSSPSCLIDGFFGKRGGTPSGILGTWPEPEKKPVKLMYSLMQKNGYTFATVYNSKCVSVFLHQTISTITIQVPIGPFTSPDCKGNSMWFTFRLPSTGLKGA